MTLCVECKKTELREGFGNVCTPCANAKWGTPPTTPRSYMSTDYRAKCIEWVLTGHAGQTVHADQIIKEAKAVYAYVYGDNDAPHADS